MPTDGAAIMLSIAMGVRQSLGRFQTPVVQDLGIGVADVDWHTVQNIICGFTQPVAAHSSTATAGAGSHLPASSSTSLVWC